MDTAEAFMNGLQFPFSSEVTTSFNLVFIIPMNVLISKLHRYVSVNDN